MTLLLKCSLFRVFQGCISNLSDDALLAIFVTFRKYNILNFVQLYSANRSSPLKLEVRFPCKKVPDAILSEHTKGHSKTFLRHTHWPLKNEEEGHHLPRHQGLRGSCAPNKHHKKHVHYLPLPLKFHANNTLKARKITSQTLRLELNFFEARLRFEVMWISQNPYHLLSAGAFVMNFPQSCAIPDVSIPTFLKSVHLLAGLKRGAGNIHILATRLAFWIQKSFNFSFKPFFFRQKSSSF